MTPRYKTVRLYIYMSIRAYTHENNMYMRRCDMPVNTHMYPNKSEILRCKRIVYIPRSSPNNEKYFSSEPVLLIQRYTKLSKQHPAKTKHRHKQMP